MIPFYIFFISNSLSNDQKPFAYAHASELQIIHFNDQFFVTRSHENPSKISIKYINNDRCDRITIPKK